MASCSSVWRQTHLSPPQRLLLGPSTPLFWTSPPVPSLIYFTLTPNCVLHAAASEILSRLPLFYSKHCPASHLSLTSTMTSGSQPPSPVPLLQASCFPPYSLFMRAQSLLRARVVAVSSAWIPFSPYIPCLAPFTPLSHHVADRTVPDQHTPPLSLPSFCFIALTTSCHICPVSFFAGLLCSLFGSREHIYIKYCYIPEAKNQSLAHMQS